MNDRNNTLKLHVSIPNTQHPMPTICTCIFKHVYNCTIRPIIHAQLNALTPTRVKGHPIYTHTYIAPHLSPEIWKPQPQRTSKTILSCLSLLSNQAFIHPAYHLHFLANCGATLYLLPEYGTVSA